MTERATYDEPAGAVRPRPSAAHDRRPAIEVRGLRRAYGRGGRRHEAVRGVDLTVAHGEVVALLGTNGAGKTSTLEVVEGLAPASAGEVRVLGLDPVLDRAAVRRRTGVLLQHSGFPKDLTVREVLTMWSATLTAPRPVDEAVAMLGLEGRRDTRVVSLSGGEQRRLDLACTLMGDPEVVMLDEPTTGLDPESRRDVWAIVRGLRDAGRAVLLTTHYLDEAEALADRVAIMHAGRVVEEGTPVEIAAGHPATISFLAAGGAGDPASGRAAAAGLDDALASLAGRAVADRGVVTVETDRLQDDLLALLRHAEAAGLALDGLHARTASLESVFLALAARGDAPPNARPDARRDPTTPAIPAAAATQHRRTR